MEWIVNQTRYWRIAGLLLLVAALTIGPWVYDQISVPAEYACSAPFVRLEEDFCGVPLSGAWLLFTLISWFAVTAAGLVTGTLGQAESGRNVLALIPALLILLPVASSLILILRGDRRRLLIVHLAGLCLACGLVLWALSAEAELRTLGLWGPWLYLGSVFGMLILEGVTFISRRRANQTT